MTNHNPNITSSNASGSFAENTNTTGSTALHTLSGTMNFKDSDNGDTHTTSAALKSATLSSGSVIPASTLASIASAMSSTILVDSNTSGKLKWTFSAEDDEFDFLAKNQTLTLKYEITLFDNHGGSTKKTVTVTITGTDDKPVIDFGAFGVVSEQDNQALSLSPDTVDVAVHFVDVDLTNTGHTASVIDVEASGATGGLLPGILGELELRSFFHINSVVKPSGSSDGTINTTFSAPDLAFDYLAEGETVDITYTIRLNDNAGGITTQTVVITVIGSNDAPIYLSGPDTAHLVEGEDLTASDDLLFVDIDLSDGHAVETSVVASHSELSEAQLLAALSTEVDPDSTGQLFGEVDWAFALDNSDVAFLNSGETLTITYTLTLTDDAGGTDTQTVTVTILGTNDPVVVVSAAQSASLAEFADTTGSAALNTTMPVPTDSIAFTDSDIGDTHTVAVAFDTAVWSGGPAVPAATEANLAAALLTTLIDSTGTGSGSIDWWFSIEDQDLDFLAFGETLMVTYDVSVSDGPTSASQTVTITAEGANDAVLMTSGPGSASITEFADTGGSSAQNGTSPVPTGTLTFADVDLNDTHFVAVQVASAVWSTGQEVPAGTQSSLASALSTALNDSTGSGAGGVDWWFSIRDGDLDFLADGDTLVVTYEVTVFDAAFTSSTQTVTVTITGTADVFAVNPVTNSAFDTANVDDGQVIATGNVIVDGGAVGGDGSTSLTVTAVNGSGGNVGTFIVGTYGNLQIAADGQYVYVANSALDLLAAGDNPTEIFTFTVEDGVGGSETETLTISVVGADETPMVFSVNPVTSSAFDTSNADDGQAVAAGNVIADGGSTGGPGSTSLTITAVNGSGGNVGTFVAGTYGTLLINSGGQYVYVASSALDLLTAADSPTDVFTFTAADGVGGIETETLTINVFGADDAAVITSADTTGSVTEDAGPTINTNGSFESGSFVGWTATSAGAVVEFTAAGGVFGNYSARLSPTATPEVLFQDIETTPGESYILSFYVSGDPESSSNSMTVTWDGATVLALTDQTGGLTHYTFEVTATDALSTLAFTYTDDGIAMFVDAVTVSPATPPATQAAAGTIAFTDIETADIHTASFIEQGGGYVGAFTLDPVSEASGSGSVGWHFTVDNDDIQFLAQNQTVVQSYLIFVTGDGGAAVGQEVSVTLHGTNDAPTTVGADNVITNADAALFLIPEWTLTRNDTDPDATDSLNVNSVTGTAGLDAGFLFGFLVAQDDGTLGGSFDYDTTDGMAVSAGSGTVTVTNNAASTTVLTGTSGDDIIIGTVGGETLAGAAGSDILVVNSGSHTLTGGSGDDIFAFEVVPDGANSITDFDNVVDDDLIAISASAFGGGLTAGMDVASVFESSSDGAFIVPESRFHYNTSSGELLYSSDGGMSVAVVATLQAGVLLNASDLLIV